MTKARLIERLKWYYPLEKFHALVTFPVTILVLLYRNPINDVVFLLYGLLVCVVILYQGQHYWKLKLYRMMGKEVNQSEALQFFRKSKKFNFFLISLMPLFFTLQLYLQNWDMNINKFLFWGVLANVFAILEHVNYYYIQLMVDNGYDMAYLMRNKRLKKASLAKDLIENQI
jgi:hypothetical protein